MTRSQRELLVEQYMTSGMSVDQEKEFFMRVATDGELFQTLRSYRMVERALYNDREAIPDGYFAVQNRAMALLMATGDQVSSATRTGARVRSGSTSGSFWSMVVSVSMISATVGFFAHAAFAPPVSSVQPARTRISLQQERPAPISNPPATHFDAPGQPVSPQFARTTTVQKVAPNVVASMAKRTDRVTEPRSRVQTTGTAVEPSSGASGNPRKVTPTETDAALQATDNKPAKAVIVPRDTQGDSLRMRITIRHDKTPE
jgi:hypothetical protein